MKKEKNYLPSSIKEIKTQYGSMLVANFKMEELKAIESKGWVSLVICERKEPSEKGATHYAYKSEYQRQNTQSQGQMSPEPSNLQPTSNPMEDDDLPF